MELIKNIIIYGILGAIQGFSEPIPISSSGHLVIFQSIFEKMGLMVPQMNDVTFEVIVNTGSLLAIMYYYRHDIVRLFTAFFGYIRKPKKRNYYEGDFRYCILLIVRSSSCSDIRTAVFFSRTSFFSVFSSSSLCRISR